MQFTITIEGVISIKQFASLLCIKRLKIFPVILSLFAHIEIAFCKQIEQTV